MSFQLSIVTPESAVLECEARSVVFPAHDGDIGILTGRAPLLTQLGVGTLKVQAEDGTHRLLIDGGFAQMVDNKLTILTELAQEASEIDRGAARQALEGAMKREVKSAEDYAERRREIDRARAQLKLLPSD